MMRSATHVRAVWLAAFIVMDAAGCAGKLDFKTSEPGLDRKLSTFAFIEEGNLVSFIVDSRAAMYRDEDAYVPLEICIANRGLPELTVTRESFTLVDAEGTRYPCVGPKELLEQYDFLDQDRRLQELQEIVFNRFSTFTRYASRLSPIRDVAARPFTPSTVHDRVVLPRFGFLVDVVYFPRPATGLKGKRFELFFSTPELEEAVFVKFKVL